MLIACLCVTEAATVFVPVSEPIPLPTFSDKVATNLPPIFKDITTLGKTPTEKDMLLLASITILSGAFPEVFAIYDDMR